MGTQGDSGPGRLSAGRLAFLFGVADTPSLPGPVLVRLLGDLGVGPSASRSLLARLRESGDLVTQRTGRITTYTMAGAMRDAWDRGATAQRPTEKPPWSGELHGILWSVPEVHRSFRDQLRRLTRLTGYAPLHPGLFVAVEDRWDVVVTQMGEVPEGARVSPLQLRMQIDHARAAARDAWDLDGLADRYRTLTETLDASMAEPVASGPHALRRYEALTHPAYRALIDDPGLPPELLPEDWPVPDLLRALNDVGGHHGAAAEAHVTEVRGLEGPSG